MRTLLRDYILVLKNTGMRHGTEALGLKWKDITFVTKDKEKYLQLTVTGKTGRRTLIANHHTETYLHRLQLRQPTLAKLSEAKLANDAAIVIAARRSGYQ